MRRVLSFGITTLHLSHQQRLSWLYQKSLWLVGLALPRRGTRTTITIADGKPYHLRVPIEMEGQQKLVNSTSHLTNAGSCRIVHLKMLWSTGAVPSLTGHHLLWLLRLLRIHPHPGNQIHADQQDIPRSEYYVIVSYTYIYILTFLSSKCFNILCSIMNDKTAYTSSYQVSTILMFAMWCDVFYSVSNIHTAYFQLGNPRGGQPAVLPSKYWLQSSKTYSSS